MSFASRNIVRTAALACGLWFGVGTAALAQSWIGPLVAVNEDVEHDCVMEVSGNGRYYRLDARGLEPDELAQLVVLNEDMRPIDRTVRASADGTWAEFYVPILPAHRGGVVRASLTGARCNLQVAFVWSRPGVPEGPTPAWARSYFPEE